MDWFVFSLAIVFLVIFALWLKQKNEATQAAAECTPSIRIGSTGDLTNDGDCDVTLRIRIHALDSRDVILHPGYTHVDSRLTEALEAIDFKAREERSKQRQAALNKLTEEERKLVTTPDESTIFTNNFVSFGSR